ncbi:NUDIX hydrolase [Nitriliruptor alkaliphilus]|uniref:NUDIX hydrolase n=1 Tax=Nitriliruptor alkaliphilus TaxID=427918 RepID=UPI0006990D00|nr:NUDIX domain-containing protein [Nitriliruptor alkaliphilus]
MTAGDPQRAGRRLRAQAVHRLTPSDIGERVSIRHLVVTGASSEPVASDVVGRLLGYEAGILALVRRDGQLAFVDEAAIVASRVVPAHPRLPAEPTDVGTADHPLDRDAARVLLVDDRDQVLLVAHQGTPDRIVWTAPGGGLQPGEDHHSASVRELTEELGLDADVGPWVWSRTVTFRYAGVHLRQTERWFLARVSAYDEVTAPLDDAGLVAARWWSLAELRRTDERLAPRALPDHLEAILRDGPPTSPVDVGR